MSHPRSIFPDHRRLRRLAGALAVAAAVASAGGVARADMASRNGTQGFGPVLGVGLDPDQVHFGLRWGVGELAPRLDLRLGVEAGVGDGVTRGSFPLDALYRFRDQWSVWQPYAGGVISIGVLDRDLGRDRRGVDLGDDTDAEPGINLIGGVSRSVGDGDRFLTELRIGIGEAPDLGLSVGWLFR